jgi:hypothetical protein
MEAWRHMLMTFFYGLANILPWFAATTAAVVIISLTPFGRALTRYLRDSRLGQGLTPELENAIAALRNDSLEILERLDFLERALAQRDLPPGATKPAMPPAPRSMDTPSGRVRTPV